MQPEIEEYFLMRCVSANVANYSILNASKEDSCYFASLLSKYFSVIPTWQHWEQVIIFVSVSYIAEKEGGGGVAYLIAPNPLRWFKENMAVNSSFD